MKIKMTINSQLSILNPNNKLSNKQNMNRIRDTEIIWSVISWEGKGENGGKGAGLRITNWQVQNRKGMFRTVQVMEQ